MSTQKSVSFTALLLTALLLSSCIDDKTAPSSDVTSEPVSVSVTPQATTLPPRGGFNFSASVSGSGNTTVNWSIQEGSSGGAITNNANTNKGEYTAPATAGTFHVIATSQRDTTKTATATVTVSSILDASFGTAGKTSTAFNSIDVINAMTLQADGKIIAAGSSLNGIETDFALARYLSDGSLDPAFGTGGIVVTTLGGSTEITAIQLQSDGKIVVGGNTSNTENSNFALARYLENGSLDTTFGQNGAGYVKTSINPGNDKLNALVIQSDGKIVAGGFSSVITDPGPPVPNNSAARNKFALARYNTDGTLDSGFGTGGMVTTVTGSGHDEIRALAIDGAGNIIAGGFSFVGGNNGGNNDFALARYSTNGTLDTAFDTDTNTNPPDGKVTTAIGSGNESITALAIDGANIIAGGFSSNGANNDFALARYLPNGGLDTTNFGGGTGFVTTAIGSGAEEIRALAVLPGNKIIVGGFSSVAGNRDFALAQYLSDGSLDPAFGTGGEVITALGAGTDEIKALAFDTTNNKIVAGGFSFVGTSVAFALARYTSVGGPDPAFDTDGTLTTKVGGGTDEINAIAVQTDGKIVSAGFAFGVNNIKNKDFALARFNADGTLDTLFGTGGKVTTAIGQNNATGHDEIHAVALQTDGKIVAGGVSRNAGTGDDFLLARYNTNGVLDPGFGIGGLRQTAINANDEEINAILLQTDGKIIAAGTSFTNGAPNHHDFTLARYTASGSLDTTTFGTAGIVKTPIGTGSFAEAAGLQPDGKIVVAGSSESAAGFDFALVRYNANGTLDTTFDADGIVTTSISAGHDFAKAMQIQSDGKIVVAGVTFPDAAPEQFALVRYEANGTLDSGFGEGGIVTTPIAGGSQAFALGIQPLGGSQAFALGIQPLDGKIVVGGFSNSTRNSRDFTLVRYLPNGTLDATFGVDGIEISPFSGGMDEMHDLIILSNGNLLAAGFSINGHGEDADFHLARYAP